MITKRLFSIIFAMPMAVSSFADSGLSGLSDAADGVGSYLPYVQGVCYAIAAVIAVAGAMSIYLSNDCRQLYVLRIDGYRLTSVLRS